MRINQNRSKKPLVIILVCALVAAALAAAYFLYFHHSDNASRDTTNGTNYNKPTNDQIKAGNDAKKQTVENNQTSTTNPKTNQSTPSGPASTLQTQITAASVQNGTLYIRNSISGIYNDGTCSLTLTHGDQTIDRSAGVQALPQSSTCKGFNITTAGMASGIWNINLTVTINGQSATATGKVTI